MQAPGSMYDAILIRFSEIWLKGKNRQDFISQLYKNISYAIKSQSYESFKNERDRFVIYLNNKSDLNAIAEKLKHIPGIEWFAFICIANATIESIISKGSELVGKNPVKIVAHRAYKQHKFTSSDIVHEFISRQNELGITAEKNAKLSLNITVLKDTAMLYTEKIKGVGGLPVGSSGKAVILLSGGIDSPVAAFYAMKRGLEPIYLHFHAFESNDSAMNSKVPEIIRQLGYCQHAKAYYAPFYPFQASVLKIPNKYELVLFKHFMYRIAERIAKNEGAKAIVTGESLGQVASQTLQNLSASQYGIKTLILRPLIAADKAEIISKARDIGTYELSIRQYRDVCSIRARNPSTAVPEKLVAKLYKDCNLSYALRKTEKLMCLQEYWL